MTLAAAGARPHEPEPAEGAQGLRRPGRCRPGGRRSVTWARLAAEAGRHRPRRHAARRRRRGQPAHPRGARRPAGTPASPSSASPAAVRGCSTASATALDGRGIAVLAQGGFVVDLERDEVLRTVGAARGTQAARGDRADRGGRRRARSSPSRTPPSRARSHSPLRVQHGFDWPYPEPAHLLPRHEVLPPGAVLKVFLRSSTLDQDELLALARSRRRPGRRRGHPRRARLHRGAAARASPRPPGSRSRWSATASASATSSCSATCPTTCR